MTLYGCVGQASAYKHRAIDSAHFVYGTLCLTLLIGLFLYPLLRFYFQRRQNCEVFLARDIVKKTIRRSLMRMLLYYAVTLVVAVAVCFLPKKTPNYLHNAMWDVSTTCGGIAIVFSYDDIIGVMFRFCQHCRPSAVYRNKYHNAPV